MRDDKKTMEQLHAELGELREQLRLNKVILDGMPCVALLIRTGTREIVASNQAAVEVGAVPGKTCFATWGQREDPCPWCLAPETWSTQAAQRAQVEALESVLDTHWVPVSDDLCLHLVFDITERVQAEKNRAKLEEKMRQSRHFESLGVMAGGIAHNFNNLLMAILGNANLALEDLTPEALAHASVVEIVEAGQRAADLTRQLLAYSGRGAFSIEPVDINSLVEEMAGLLDLSQTEGAEVQYHLAQDPPAMEADVSQVRQALMNLVANASEAIGNAAGSIVVSTGAIEATRDYLAATYIDDDLRPGLYTYVEVTDTGSGMDEATLKRIFEPFRTKSAGRGLGLAAVLGIVRGHKGAIEVHSKPGEGTSFKVLFPSAVTPG